MNRHLSSLFSSIKLMAASVLVVSISATFVSTAALAEPTVTVTDPATGQPIVTPSANAPNLNADNLSNPASPGEAPSNAASADALNSPTATMSQNSLGAQLQPTESELSKANQELLSRNAELQREVNDLQTQVNVLIYESQGQLFLYGAFTVLISLLVGIFVSWLVFVRRQRW